MSKIVQSYDGETATPLAEFERLGDGVRCTYHHPGFRRNIELNGIWTEETGKLFPSDGQKFLDALPIAFANSSRIRVIDNHDGKHTDYYDPEKATQPDPNTPPKPMVLNSDDESETEAPVPPTVAKKIRKARKHASVNPTKAPPGLGNAKPGEVVPAPTRKKKPGAAPPPPPGMHSDDEE